jgi:hypothetical protein
MRRALGRSPLPRELENLTLIDVYFGHGLNEELPTSDASKLQAQDVPDSPNAKHYPLSQNSLTAYSREASVVQAYLEFRLA